MPEKNEARITAVIPAFNEAKHINRVLDPLSSMPQLNEIIVVDDGSVDDTAAVVRAYRAADERIQLVSLPHNVGKGGAIMAGIQASCPDLLVLLDADLIDLRPSHILSLVRPVQQRRCAMTLGIFKNGRQQTNLSHRYFYFLSGQRCLRWSAFGHSAAFHETRWGIEMAFNLTAWQRGLRVQQVPWEGVSHTMRLEKMPGLSKYWTYVEMWGDIMKFLLAQGVRQWVQNGRTASWKRQLTPGHNLLD
ncbi:MAG: glycosyltransferase [Anaerolineaceae bacterium]|nr:glycosyltransferase [Anaerolineaceae bacterium]